MKADAVATVRTASEAERLDALSLTATWMGTISDISSVSADGAENGH